MATVKPETYSHVPDHQTQHPPPGHRRQPGGQANGRTSRGLLPKHLADQESIVFVHEGECIIHINNADVCLKPGEAYAVPADVVHQIKVIRDFRGIHIMPKEIQFTYFD